MYSTNQQFESMPPFMQDMYKDIATTAKDLATRKYERNDTESSRLAPIPADLMRAHEMGRRTGMHIPFMQRAEGLLQGAGKPFHQVAKEYMNPYQKQVVEQIANEGNRNFTENVLPAIEAKFLRLGQHGGSRHADLSLRAARDLQREIMERQSQAMATGYQQSAQMHAADQARALEGARGFGDLGGMAHAGNLADIAMLENQGRYQQQQQQAENDIKQEDFLRQHDYPYNRLAWLNSMMHGIPHQGLTASWSRTPSAPQTNVLGQLGPLAGKLWTMRRQMGEA